MLAYCKQLIARNHFGVPPGGRYASTTVSTSDAPAYSPKVSGQAELYTITFVDLTANPCSIPIQGLLGGGDPARRAYSGAIHITGNFGISGKPRCTFSARGALQSLRIQAEQSRGILCPRLVGRRGGRCENMAS